MCGPDSGNHLVTHDSSATPVRETERGKTKEIYSFQAAAIDLDVSPTAIGNAVASLESRLGVRLFNRTTRNVALTSAGREYVEAIAPALSDIRAWSV